MASGSRPYHHGNLRPALISAAIGEIEESGPAAMSLRAVARRAGVTHAAATYHFGDRAGLLTAVAAEGYRLLAEALRGAQETRGSFLEVGVAYVRFAVTHRAHFEVMYRPELYHRDDAELGRAREAAATLLYGTGEITRERMAYGVAAWSIVHGLATLWLNGNLPAQLGDDPEEITRVVAAHLDPPRRDPALAGRQPGKAVGGRIADSTHGGGKLMPYVRAGEENSGRIEIYDEDHGRRRRRWARSASQRRPASVTGWPRKPGAVFADAPVPGSKDPAERGQLLILASGPAAAAGTAGPVSGIIGRKTVRLGEAGRGSQVKLVVNAYMSVLIEGVAETTALADRLGIGHPQLAAVIEDGPLDAPIADRRCQAHKTNRRDDAPEFPLERTLKDADLALRAASGADLPLLAALSRRWHAAADTGHGREDISAARLALRQPGTD